MSMIWLTIKVHPWGGKTWIVKANSSRTLEIAIPPVEMTPEQAKAFQEIIDYAKTLGVDVVTRIVE